MRRFCTILLASGALTAHAQDLPGFRTSNYAGVNSVFANPANIADSKYSWDFNLAGVSSGIANNQFKYQLSNVGKAFEMDTIKNQFFNRNGGASKALITGQVSLPSVMFGVKKFKFAISNRVRVVGNVNDIDGKLAGKIIDGFSDGKDLPYTIASGNKMRTSANVWYELNMSAAREIFQIGPHYLKGGLTLKFLAGLGNGSMQVDNLQGTLVADEARQDAALTNASGRIGTHFSGFSLFDGNNNNGTSSQTASGYGFDIGFVYEYRNDITNDYKFRLGLAITDIGSMKYTADPYRSGTFDINIPANQRFYLSNLNGVNIEDYKNKLESYPQYFQQAKDKADETYKVSLPGMLNLDGDYHIERNFFVNVSGQFSLATLKKKAYNSQYIGGFSITPRYDGRIFGFFLPLSYNQISKFNAGASFRVGPLYVGSGTVLSALLGSSRQVDGFVGIRFGRLARK
ncbi:DUF5723 family protein [Chitinophaga sp. Cy-1792]|uniref:DUF5723 family protein n=1 Tax=Chitinophaga sp. Cy-1792 TaxID=2608339 RepID=UPI00141ECA86|nr:DUF5723 family protein [Chitinophaga sp. Cy-1792]NIG53214.1 hypothetical protein [Chitinophaga sp. Cy-1792]